MEIKALINAGVKIEKSPKEKFFKTEKGSKLIEVFDKLGKKNEEEINKFKNELWENQASEKQKEEQNKWQNKYGKKIIPKSQAIEAIISRWNYLNSEEYDEEKAKEKNKQTEMNNKINTEFNNIEEKIKIYTEKFINDIKLESPKDNKYTILFQPNLSERGREILEKLKNSKRFKKIDITKWNKIREEIHDEMNNEKNNENSKNIIKIILKKYTNKNYELKNINSDKDIKKNIENAANEVIPIGGSVNINKKRKYKKLSFKKNN